MRLFLSALLAFVLAGCGVQFGGVEPRQPDHINPPAPVVLTVKPSPVPNYYHVYTDARGNVICVTTDLDINYFECGPDDWKHVK